MQYALIRLVMLTSAQHIENKNRIENFKQKDSFPLICCLLKLILIGIVLQSVQLDNYVCEDCSVRSQGGG